MEIAENLALVVMSVHAVEDIFVSYNLPSSMCKNRWPPLSLHSATRSAYWRSRPLSRVVLCEAASVHGTPGVHQSACPEYPNAAIYCSPSCTLFLLGDDWAPRAPSIRIQGSCSGQRPRMATPRGSHPPFTRPKSMRAYPMIISFFCFAGIRFTLLLTASVRLSEAKPTSPPPPLQLLKLPR
ncbi:hypothetical protein BC834DRAFT_898197 [Gloeopeniophorella convolvens]|nr:hypothetical protein BC834DRAFT_898197 [Gloeopeniophorella convolvens]